MSLGTIADPAAAATATFLGLGDLPGARFYSFAEGVSADGTVVVGASESSDHQLEAFRWTRGGGMVGLGSISSSYGRSIAHAVSGNGSVVVGVGDGELFRWTSDTGTVGLGNLFGHFTVGHATSFDGSVIVGRSGGAPVSDPQAFRWTMDTGIVPLVAPAGIARGVSADGSVIVGDSGGAARWTNDDGLTLLFTERGVAHAVSADGSIVVGWFHKEDFGSEAFRWTSDGGPVGLGDLPGGDFFSVALGVSGDGSVVVGVSEVAPGEEDEEYGSPGDRAFRWTKETGMQNLRDFLIAGGATGVTGWTLWEATGVSADGRTIVGYGTNPSGDFEGWIATYSAVVPEPTSSLLALTAVLVVLMARRQLIKGATPATPQATSRL